MPYAALLSTEFSTGFVDITGRDFSAVAEFPTAMTDGDDSVAKPAREMAEAAAPGGLSHARCQGRRALCRQGAQSEEPRRQLHAHFRPVEPAAPHGRGNRHD